MHYYGQDSPSVRLVEHWAERDYGGLIGLHDNCKVGRLEEERKMTKLWLSPICE